jgi:signal recognition particle receptor subunit beta
MLNEDELKDAVLLVLANKQDLPRAMSVEQVTELLDLRNLRFRRWNVFPTTAIDGKNLFEAFDWLANEVGCVPVVRFCVACLQ